DVVIEVPVDPDDPGLLLAAQPQTGGLYGAASARQVGIKPGCPAAASVVKAAIAHVEHVIFADELEAAPTLALIPAQRVVDGRPIPLAFLVVVLVAAEEPCACDIPTIVFRIGRADTGRTDERIGRARQQ